MAEANNQGALQQQADIAARTERRQIIAAEIKRITKCDGSDPTLVRQWIQEIQLARGLPDNAAAIELISGSTTGVFKLELEAFLGQQANRDDVPWQAIRTHLLQCFVSADHQEFHRGLLAKVKQQPGENILAYNRRFRQAALEAFPGERNADQNRELVRLYGKGLLEAIAAKKLVTNGWPQTLENAFERMSARETAQERYQHLGRQEEDMEVAVVATPTAVPVDTIQRKLDQLMTKMSKLEIQQQQQRDQRSSSSYRSSYNPRRPPPTYQQSPRRMDRPSPRNRPTEDRTCYRCQQQGHIARDCRKAATDTAAPRQSTSMPKN